MKSLVQFILALFVLIAVTVNGQQRPDLTETCADTLLSFGPHPGEEKNLISTLIILKNLYRQLCGLFHVYA